MNFISQYKNGDRKAVVEEAVHGYSVTMYIDEKAISRTTVGALVSAESLAESFISTGQSTSQLLSEYING